jgi:hypothetical protein
VWPLVRLLLLSDKAFTSTSPRIGQLVVVLLDVGLEAVISAVGAMYLGIKFGPFCVLSQLIFTMHCAQIHSLFIWYVYHAFTIDPTVLKHYRYLTNPLFLHFTTVLESMTFAMTLDLLDKKHLLRVCSQKL